MILVKNCNVFAPESMGRQDVLIAGEKIVAIGDTMDVPSGWDIDVVDAGGLIMIPGLIDSHVHIAGAGGEGGPATRTPEMPLGRMLEAGVTTVVGCLGTDGMTRSIESVLMKAKGLKQEGVSAYIYTGAYQVPTPTILGDVGKDIAMIEEVIGAGEIALSDHRSSTPTLTELVRIAAHARVGGMLGGKGGIVNIHMGDADDPFRPLYDAKKMSEIPLKQFLPTHCNRNETIFEEAKEYGIQGYVDLTTSGYPFFPDEEVKPSTGIAQLLGAGVPAEHITMSSDGCGSLPQFDENGNLEKLESGSLKSLFDEMRDAVRDEGVAPAIAVQTVTANVADILKLPYKGRIIVGNDADFVLLDGAYNMVYLCARGRWMAREGNIIQKGTYEQ